MANNTRLISGGTTYYLAGGSASQVPYAGSATPWTVQTTTPFELSLNDTTGPIYTPAPALTVPILGGGPPFRLGRSLITKSYDTVTESVGVQLRATSHDNAVALLRILRQVLNTALFDSPCILAVQPDGATNAAYSEILYADVPEKPDYIWETSSGACLFRATITWTRTIGSAGALTTLINAVSIRNRSSLSPDDVESLGTPVGDLINEGQPLNIQLAPAASSDISTTLYLATVYERIYTSVADTDTTTTATVFTAAAPVITNARNRAPLKVRILARFDTFTNPSKIRLRCDVDYGNGVYTLKTLPTQALPNAAATSTLIDFGSVDITPARSILASTLTIQVRISLISSDGTSVTAKLDYVETLLYYTFAKITGSVDSSSTLVCEAANDYNVNGIVTPNATPRVYVAKTSDGTIHTSLPWRGTLPRAYAGASLWVAWLASANAAHDTTDTATLTAKHLPLFHTLRGGV
jgi:hypothetical protein